MYNDQLYVHNNRNRNHKRNTILLYSKLGNILPIGMSELVVGREHKQSTTSHYGDSSTVSQTIK